MPEMSQNVTFNSKNGENEAFCSLRQFPFVNAFGADFLHFTIFAILQKDEMTALAGQPAAQPVNYRFSFFVRFLFWCEKRCHLASAMKVIQLFKPKMEAVRDKNRRRVKGY